MINIFGPLNTLGIGVHCYNLAKAYEKRKRSQMNASGEPPVLAMFPPFGRDGIQDTHTQRWLSNRVFSDVRRQPSLMIFDTQFMFHFAGNPRIGFVVFETTEFTPLQINAIRSLDHVIVPTIWAQVVLENYGVSSFVVNEGFDPETFPMSILLKPEDKDRPFRFIHVGKLEERKGTIQAVRCFAREFSATESVELVLRSENPFLDNGGRSVVSEALNQEGFRAVRWLQPGAPSVWERDSQRVYWTESVNKLSPMYIAADCGIFPSKGEGWGLPILECIASGTPVICGNWTGMSEYIRNGEGTQYPEELILAHAKLELAQDGIWFHGDRGDWFVPEDHEVEKKMRWAFDHARDLIREAAWINAVLEARKFTWDRAAEQLDHVLARILK